jgi:hypothetical protein
MSELGSFASVWRCPGYFRFTPRKPTFIARFRMSVWCRLCCKSRKSNNPKKSRGSRSLDFSAAASLFSATTGVGDRFSMKRYGPSPRHRRGLRKVLPGVGIVDGKPQIRRSAFAEVRLIRRARGRSTFTRATRLHTLCAQIRWPDARGCRTTYVGPPKPDREHEAFGTAESKFMRTSWQKTRHREWVGSAGADSSPSPLPRQI